MKITTAFRILLLTLGLAVLLSLCACTDVDVGVNTALAEEFMDYTVNDDYAAAYGLVSATVTDPDFRDYWETIRPAVADAKTYELEQIRWNVNSYNGVTTRTTAYQVYLDNGRTALLRVVTQDGIEGIAGIHFSDITEFLAATDAVMPTVRIILWVFSGLCIAFTVWMLVDCILRKLKYKVLWLLLIVVGLTLTVTVGEASNFSFSLGLFCIPSSIVADPGIVSVVTTVIVPVGAILYLCLRKRFALPEPLPHADVGEEPLQNPVDKMDPPQD